jgi:hypothetical protein
MVIVRCLLRPYSAVFMARTESAEVAAAFHIAPLFRGMGFCTGRTFRFMFMVQSGLWFGIAPCIYPARGNMGSRIGKSFLIFSFFLLKRQTKLRKSSNCINSDPQYLSVCQNHNFLN